MPQPNLSTFRSRIHLQRSVKASLPLEAAFHRLVFASWIHRLCRFSYPCSYGSGNLMCRTCCIRCALSHRRTNMMCCFSPCIKTFMPRDMSLFNPDFSFTLGNKGGKSFYRVQWLFVRSVSQSSLPRHLDYVFLCHTGLGHR